MDSQKTDTAGFKYFKEFDQFELQSFTSATDTFVILATMRGNPYCMPHIRMITTQKHCEKENHSTKKLGLFQKI